MFPWQFLRQRRVLAIIFCSSLLYFLIKTELLVLPIAFVRRRIQHTSKSYFDSQFLRAPKSIAWHSSDGEKTAKNETSESPRQCRFTKQSGRWIADDAGFLCERDYLSTTGCCPVSPISRYVCSSCDVRQTHCCVTYEHCVSCCLHPSKRSILETVLKHTTGSRLRTLLALKDQYELCEWKCRTSSNSVYNENKYKNQNAKHCYGPEPKLPYSR